MVESLKGIEEKDHAIIETSKFSCNTVVNLFFFKEGMVRNEITVTVKIIKRQIDLIEMIEEGWCVFFSRTN
jgi:hypothetical protein